MNICSLFSGLDKEGSQIDELERIGRGRSYFEQGKSALVPVGGDHLTITSRQLRSLVESGQEKRWLLCPMTRKSMWRSWISDLYQACEAIGTGENSS
ncbi:MAG: hypothetical protein R3C24_04425 [Cyanobacteriota/Melainabacteria group bacterium]